MEIKTLAQKLLFNTIRLETYDINGQPIGTGTSFLINHRFENGHCEHFLITNKHVIEGGYSGYFYFTEKINNKPEIGKPFFIQFDMLSSIFHGHPDDEVDIAVTPMNWHFDMLNRPGGRQPFYESISTELFPDSEFTNSLNLLEQVIFVGYPNGLYDSANYTPILRRGGVATPYQLDYGGGPIFIIDASVFPGSSGSPVFSYFPSQNSDATYEENFRLLGVVSAVFIQEDEGQIIAVPVPTNSQQLTIFNQLLDLGIVFKSRTIIETIDDFIRQKGKEFFQYSLRDK